MSNVVMCLCSHKKAEFPKDEIYVPIIVGSGKEDKELTSLYQTDDKGENISEKNSNYCELTALYYAWKNLDYDVIGLVHYRRLFLDKNSSKKKIENAIKKETIEKLLSEYDFILPRKRNYYIESNYSHYIHAHHQEPLDETRKIIEEKYPEYLESFDKHMKKRSGHYFNMFIAKKETADKFLTWMFDILFELEKRVDLSNYSKNEKRVFGFISELLFDVYINANKLKVHDQKYVFLEKQNWCKKIFNFIKRKFVKVEK